MKTRALLAGVAVVGVVVGAATSAQADPIKCQQGLAKASAKYVQGRAKVLDKCEQAKTKVTLPPATACPSDPTVGASLGKLGTTLGLSIARACGGADKTCGNGDDDPLGSIGWGSVPSCPDFESSGCTNAIASCTDIATCLKCVDDAAVDQAL